MALPTVQLSDLPDGWLDVSPNAHGSDDPPSVLGGISMPPQWSLPGDDAGADPSGGVFEAAPSIFGGVLNPKPWTLADSSLNAFVDPETMKTIDFDGAAPPELPPWTVIHGGETPPTVPTLNPINNQNAAPPSDSSLDFDPHGLNDWSAFLLHPMDALKAYQLGNEAQGITKNLYPDDPGQRHNDSADAFRHAYWNYTMTNAFGPDEARAFGDAHEILAPNPPGERYMDLYNNEVGRSLAADPGSPADIIQNAVAKGLTRTHLSAGINEAHCLARG